MNKEELVQVIAKKTGTPKGQAMECLNVVLDEITKILSGGGEVVLSGFGKFMVSKRKERDGINPKTRDKIKIPSMKIAKFKPGRILKDAVK